MNLNNKKAISILVKCSVLILATIFIVYKLNHNTNLSDFKRLVNQLSDKQVYSAMIALFILMLLNWFLESLKWKFLVQHIERISILKAVESVFCGLTWAIFTPNRIGEYGGRIFFLTPRKRVFGAIAMAVGAVGQMVITNVVGAVAVLWFIWNFIPIDKWLLYALIPVVIVFSLFFLLFYFNIKWLIGLLSRISFLKQFKKFYMILARYSKRDLMIVFNYAMTRFIVFTSQYCLVIHLLIPEIPILGMVMMIFILFFVQSALPSLDLLDVGVRAMTATYFFSFITQHEVAIMASTACIWFINLIIPAILGAGFVFKLNFFGTARN
ncbi:lysylphosphatidylglycerol synthase transmembrane domain-containing protein [Arcticibacter eurypsychrophilus]|uniref:lysylphosphatidylglycerol synthase domain-containing protein n=1 Tax=Arcticibacter eurypsychrophilus TaxID=1434752 RepID=UPI00084DBF04|nr:lysylphosphatidylglycerol synthase domain-containing protein [Arcticibacter eurypsychrophilus]